MKACTIYYDETSIKSTQFAHELNSRCSFACIEAGSIMSCPILYEESSSVGLLFESANGQLPLCMKRIMQHLVMDKDNYIFLFVTAGKRELHVLTSACSYLRQKGYRISAIYSTYIMKHLSCEESQWIDKLLEDYEKREQNLDILLKSAHSLFGFKLRKTLRSIRYKTQTKGMFR